MLPEAVRLTISPTHQPTHSIGSIRARADGGIRARPSPPYHMNRLSDFFEEDSEQEYGDFFVVAGDFGAACVTREEARGGAGSSSVGGVSSRFPGHRLSGGAAGCLFAPRFEEEASSRHSFRAEARSGVSPSATLAAARGGAEDWRAPAPRTAECRPQGSSSWDRGWRGALHHRERLDPVCGSPRLRAAVPPRLRVKTREQRCLDAALDRTQAAYSARSKSLRAFASCCSAVSIDVLRCRPRAPPPPDSSPAAAP